MNEREKQALYFAVCATILVFSGVFLYLTMMGGGIRLLWYHPLDRAWLFEVAPRGLAMDFYGRTLDAAATALAAGLAVGLFYRWRRRVAGDEYVLWAGWSAIALILTVAVIGWKLSQRVIVPMPPV